MMCRVLTTLFIRSLNVWIESWENWTPAQNFVWFPLPPPPLASRLLHSLFLSSVLKNSETVNKADFDTQNHLAVEELLTSSKDRDWSKECKRQWVTTRNSSSSRRILHNCVFSAGLLVSGYISQRVEILPFHVRPIPSWRRTTTSRRLRLCRRQRWGSHENFIIF